MNVGNEIVTAVIRGGDDVEMFSGLDPDCPVLFAGTDREAWLWILDKYKTYRVPPTEEIFRENFPEQVLPYGVGDLFGKELLEEAVKKQRHYELGELMSTAIDLHSAGQLDEAEKMVTEFKPYAGPGKGMLNLVPLSDLEFKPVKWVWDTTKEGEFTGSGGRFALGTLAVGAGRPGAGKGQFAAWLAAHVSRGTLPGEFYGKPKGVVIYTTEDSHEMTIGPRLQVAGADLDKVFVFRTENEELGGFQMVKLKQHLPELKQIIEDHDIGLIILDPLISVLDGKTNTNDEVAIRAELEPFQMMLENSGCLAFGIMHFRKMRDEDILNMFAGSGGFARVVRSAVAFVQKKDEDDGTITRVLSTVKNNLGRTDLPSYEYTFQSEAYHTTEGLSYTSKLVFGEESKLSAEDIHEGRGKKTATQDAVSFLYKHLMRDEPILKSAVQKIFEQTGKEYAWRTVERAATKIGVISNKEFGGEATWKLPDEEEE